MGDLGWGGGGREGLRMLEWCFSTLLKIYLNYVGYSNSLLWLFL